jgi:hypothetical protein
MVKVTLYVYVPVARALGEVTLMPTIALLGPVVVIAEGVLVPVQVFKPVVGLPKVPTLVKQALGVKAGPPV